MDDEDVDTFACYRHPDRQTSLRCSNCERPICTDCAVTAAVGMKCAECGRLPRTALATVPRGKLLTATAAGSVAGVVGAVVYEAFRANVGFLSLLFAYLIGMAVGEVVRRAAGGFRDGKLARIAAACAFVGLASPLLLVLVSRGPGAVSGQGAIFLLLGAAFAAWAAYQRAS